MKSFTLNLSIIISFTFLPIASGQRIYESSRQIFVASTAAPAPVCEGSLLIEAKDGSSHNIMENIDRINISVSSVTVIGCGCFSVHRGRNGRGRRTVIFSSSGTQDSRQIGFGRIKSIYKIDCSTNLG